MDKQPTKEEIKKAQELAREVSPMLLSLLEAEPEKPNADNLRRKDKKIQK